MSSKPRSKIIFDNCTIHKVWRAHNKEWILRDPRIKEKYLEFLGNTLHRKEVKDIFVMALALMDNHSHEVQRISTVENLSHSMRVHHSKFGQYYNYKKKRCGKVAQARPHTTCFETEYDSKEAVFYVHANPIRAGIKDERAYKWSTHMYYAYGKKPEFLKIIKFKFPKWYMDYGKTWKIRQGKYRQEFQAYLRKSSKSYTKYSSVLFCGSPLWEEAKLTVLKGYLKDLREKRKAFLEDLFPT